jgi:hypothetical protein
MKTAMLAVWLVAAVATVGAAYVVSMSPQPAYARMNTD